MPLLGAPVCVHRTDRPHAQLRDQDPITSMAPDQAVSADDTGCSGLKTGQKAVEEVLRKFSQQLPSLCKILTEDLDALLAHLNLPWRLRKYVRTTNLIERSFVEERRRTKVLPRFFTEKSCLKLVHAVLIRAANRWQNIHITSTEYVQLKLLYEQRNLTIPTALQVA